MRKVFLLLTLIFSIAASAQAAFNEVRVTKPFKRILILSGGGMKTSTYLGLVSAMIDSGQAPDLIFSSCGPALATAIMQSHLDRSTWLAAVQSPAYHNLLREVQLNNSSAVGIILRIFNKVETQNIPYIFKKYALNVPTTIDSNSTQLGLDQTFNTETIPVIMMAAELSYGPHDVGRELRDENGLEKLYQEVFFTDYATAMKLGSKLVTPIASMKGSRVFPEIKVITTASLFEASRASVSDPYYMEPMKIDSKYYQTGGVDLYPIEQAQALADEVIVAYAGNYTWIETQAVINTFGYQANERVKNILQQPATRWRKISG